MRPAAASGRGSPDDRREDGLPRPRAGDTSDLDTPRSGLVPHLRGMPIRWRILSIAVLNSAVALLLLFFIWDGARSLSGAWDALGRVRLSERLLGDIDSDAVRLQSLTHRYFHQPTPEVLVEVERRRAALTEKLLNAALDSPIAAMVQHLTTPTERFLVAFDRLRSVQLETTTVFTREVLAPAKDMAGLYAALDATVAGPDDPIARTLRQSREAFNATLLAANAYYLSISAKSGEEARGAAATIAATVDQMLSAAGADAARQKSLAALKENTGTLRQGLEHLDDEFALQDSLLREEIDGSARAMSKAIDDMTTSIQSEEQEAQARFDAALSAVFLKVAVVAIAFVLIVLLVGVAIAKSISDPLRELMRAMFAIEARRYGHKVPGQGARDEIGAMARAVEVFRRNAIDKERAEEALRGERDKAEQALADLRETQRNLIEAEKLAALGGLVAGVAHEVNNPVGISLTVASSLARRTEVFAQESRAGPMRRSRLDAFVGGVKEATDQLVANLQRAGELIQSFKQVAVDRSHTERRVFDLAESTKQIVSSLRPSLKAGAVHCEIDIPAGIRMDSDPGAYGQILTNLFLNAATHAFGPGGGGTIRVTAHRRAGGEVDILFEDDGKGMSAEVRRRAFEPFFTTLRGRGGTGLGLHIVYNLVTGRLGGRIAVAPRPGGGTSFTLSLPLNAPLELEPEKPVSVTKPEHARDR